jgi:hypothetical protein
MRRRRIPYAKTNHRIQYTHGNGSPWPQHLYPEAHRKIVPIGSGEIRPKLRPVPFFQSREIEWDGAGQELHILAIAPRVSFQLRKSQVMGFKAGEAHSAIRAREDRNQPVLIILRDSDNTHMLHVHAMLPVERRSLPASASSLPISPAGTSDRKSTSTVGRGKPYNVAMANPPMHWSAIGSSKILSMSRKNECQGSGGRSRRIRQVLRVEVRQKIPVPGIGRPRPAQPTAFRF